MFFAVLMLAPTAGAVNYRGDFNHDSRLDMQDMSALGRGIKDGTADPAVFDINADGVVDDRDLETLANVILTQSLVEDTGVNVGIGDWGDGGEWGGTVGKPRRTVPLSADGISLHARNRYDYAGRYTYTEMYLDSDVPVSGLLLDFGVPSWNSFEMDEESIRLDEKSLADHRLYGKLAKVTERDSPVVRYRIMVFSPTFASLNPSEVPLVRFRYAKEDWVEGRDMPFENCQAVLPSGSVTDIPRCNSFLEWGYRPLTDLQVGPTDIKAEQDQHIEIPLYWVPEDALDKTYDAESSDTDVAEITGTWGNKVIVYVREKKPVKITIHTGDGSDITRTVSINSGTGMEFISGDGHDGALPVYTIQGIYVGALGVEDLQTLPPGLYIRDGKKLHVPMHGM